MYTKNELIEQMSEQITDIINEASEFTKDFDDVQEAVNDEIFQMINDSQFVIFI